MRTPPRDCTEKNAPASSAPVSILILEPASDRLGGELGGDFGVEPLCSSSSVSSAALCSSESLPSSASLLAFVTLFLATANRLRWHALRSLFSYALDPASFAPAYRCAFASSRILRSIYQIDFKQRGDRVALFFER